MINRSSFLDGARDIAIVSYKRFLARIGENRHTAPSFCVLAFRNGWAARSIDACVNTADDQFMSEKFGDLLSSILRFCGRIRARQF